MSQRLGAKVLRILLVASAVGWGVSFLGVFLSWGTVRSALVALGAEDIPDDAMLMYWSKMAACTFGCVGIFFLLLALRPHGHQIMLGFGSVMMVCLGATLLVYGLKLRLGPLPFIADVSFCLGVGGGIFCLRRFADAQ